MTEFSQLSVRQLLEMAIRAEIDANRIYSDISNSLKNPLLKEKFQWLAFEEKKHKESLEKLFHTLPGEEKLAIPDKTDEALLPAINITPSSSLVEILYQAMRAEEAAGDFYLSLAQKINAPQQKILKYLSHVEHSHYTMLKSEYLMAQEFEDYGESDIEKIVT
ncbi:MAG: ferritin family protein [Candidatus Aminicenantes bacterium]|nr:ferritin family protein [Candidatus Aminicenantes bacterium]